MRVDMSNKEVLVANAHPFYLDEEDIHLLQNFASMNISQKSRICSHKHDTDLLHEMFIYHKKDYYVRPHRHIQKSESIMILKGKADLVLFNDKGDIDEVIFLDEFSSGKAFYNRIDIPIFHSLIIRSDYLIFYEATTGPFKKQDTEFAIWSPEIGGPECKVFVNNLMQKINLKYNLKDK